MVDVRYCVGHDGRRAVDKRGVRILPWDPPQDVDLLRRQRAAGKRPSPAAAAGVVGPWGAVVGRSGGAGVEWAPAGSWLVASGTRRGVAVKSEVRIVT